MQTVQHGVTTNGAMSTHATAMPNKHYQIILRGNLMPTRMSLVAALIHLQRQAQRLHRVRQACQVASAQIQIWAPAIIGLIAPLVLALMGPPEQTPSLGPRATIGRTA